MFVERATSSFLSSDLFVSACVLGENRNKWGREKGEVLFRRFLTFNNCFTFFARFWTKSNVFFFTIIVDSWILCILKMTFVILVMISVCFIFSMVISASSDPLMILWWGSASGDPLMILWWGSTSGDPLMIYDEDLQVVIL